MFATSRIAAFTALCAFALSAPAQIAHESGVAPSTPRPERPNFVFIMADDLGWGDLACYGHSTVMTPTIDELASEGTLFTRYYSVAPICSPARAAIVTGRFPAEVGVHWAISADRAHNAAHGQVDYLDYTSGELLPQRLRDAGYATGHFGKWHLGKTGAPTLDAYGFDEHRSTLSSDSNPKYVTTPPWRWSSSDQIVDDSIAFMEHHAEGPFYLQVWLTHPHSPLDPTPEQASVYSGKVTAPEPVHGWTSARHAYMSAVTSMDAAIARLLDAIDDLGIAGDTVVVFTSDNGPETQFNANSDHEGTGSTGPFRGRKGSLYEGGVRTPCIVRWSGRVEPGRVAHEAIAGVDWLPTFLALAGLPQPERTSGESIEPVLLGKQWARSRPIMMEWRFGPRVTAEPCIDISPGGAIIFGDYKLLRNRDGSRLELYNVSQGPMEADNLAHEFPGMATLLSGRLVAWQATLGQCIGCQNEGNNSYPWPR